MTEYFFYGNTKHNAKCYSCQKAEGEKGYFVFNIALHAAKSVLQIYEKNPLLNSVKKMSVYRGSIDICIRKP